MTHKGSMSWGCFTNQLKEQKIPRYYESKLLEG